MPEVELDDCSPETKPAREAWYYAAPTGKRSKRQVALRPHPDGRVEIVENTLGGTVGYFPPKLAAKWHGPISAHVNAHQALPVIRCDIGTGYALYLSMPKGTTFSID